MLQNAEEPDAAGKIASEITAHPCLQALLEAARAFPELLRVEPDASGFELAGVVEVKGLPNRGRLKVFFPDSSRVVAIFYKSSNLSFSRDRFSYGGFLTSPSKFAGEDLDVWLAYVASGLSPAKRPPSLRRAFPYTIPE